MTKILIVVCTLNQSVLTEALTQFRARGAEVSVVCNFDPVDWALDSSLAEIHPLPRMYADLGRAARATKGSSRVWFNIRDDAWVRHRARHADMMVALDPPSIYSVWELAKRNWRPAAIYGLSPALKALDAGLVKPAMSWPAGIANEAITRSGIVVRGTRHMGFVAAKRTARAVVSPTVMRSRLGAALWARAVSVPRIPDRVRAKMMHHVNKNMVSAGKQAYATHTVSRAVSHMRDPRKKADLLANAAKVEARSGNPATLAKAVTAELSIANDAYAKRSFKAAAASIRKAMALIFLRTIHYDRVEVSPLMDDAATFLAGWRKSPAVRALSAPRGRSAPAAPRPTDRPLRLLIATSGNDNFIGEIRQRYENMPGVQARFLNFRDDNRRYPLVGDPARMAEFIMSGQSGYGANVEEWLRPHLDWADTVFIDWCVAGAVMFSLLDPSTTRIIVRLHSYETFTYWPHMVDFTRVDDLVFVSEHLRDITEIVLPQVKASGTRLHVLNNAMDLLDYPRDKPADARFNLGLIGIGSVAKDPRWAVQILRLLRQRDERYRLILFGEEREAGVSEASRSYYSDFAEDLVDLIPSGAVVRLGHVEDVPKALTDVGVILSTSVRESFHCGLVEGAASGAVPVVRNWPFFATAKHGAHTLFPPDWVVNTPQEAADRTWALTQAEDPWREAGRDASLLAIKQWDWTVTQRDFDDLFLGPTAAPV